MAREMKNSGVEWIGDIPVGWERTKLLNLLRQSICDGPHETPNLIDIGIPFISVDSLNSSEKVDLKKCKKFISEEDYIRYKSKANIEENDILFTKAATIGKTAIVGKEKFMVWSPIAIIKPNYSIAFNKYVYHLLNCCDLIKHISLLGSYNTQINVGMRELEQAIVPLPPLNEQQKIASFLDQKCAEIDAVIEKTKATIEEYKKLKQAVITEAVTKGIRGNRPMKDSGIEWIGEIPVGWDICKTLYALAMPITDGPHTTPELFDEGIPFVSAEAVSCGNGKINFNHIRGYISEDFYNECCLKYTPKINDIYMIKSGATTGRVSYVDTDIKFNIWSPLAVFRVNEKRTYFKYLFYYLQSDSYQKEVQLRWNYGTQQNIGMGTLETLKVLLPTINEQKEIADYLDQKCAEIDTLIAKKTTLLSELETYKKSLIYEYVTGKKEVGEDNVSTQVAVYSPYFPITINSQKLFWVKMVLMAKTLEKFNYYSTRVKLQKTIFVLQNSIGFDLDNEYVREKYGPLDNSIFKCENSIKKRGWIKVIDKNGATYYKAGENKEAYKKYYDRYFAEHDTEIDRIINIFKDFDVQKSERIATLFGAWNDAIIDKRQFTDEDIVEDVLNNWHEHKGDYSKEEWLEDLEEMKKINLIPKGYGKKTVIKND